MHLQAPPPLLMINSVVNYYVGFPPKASSFVATYNPIHRLIFQSFRRFYPPDKHKPHSLVHEKIVSRPVQKFDLRAPIFLPVSNPSHPTFTTQSAGGSGRHRSSGRAGVIWLPPAATSPQRSLSDALTESGAAQVLFSNWLEG